MYQQKRIISILGTDVKMSDSFGWRCVQLYIDTKRNLN